MATMTAPKFTARDLAPIASSRLKALVLLAGALEPWRIDIGGGSQRIVAFTHPDAHSFSLPLDEHTLREGVVLGKIATLLRYGEAPHVNPTEFAERICDGVRLKRDGRRKFVKAVVDAWPADRVAPPTPKPAPEPEPELKPITPPPGPGPDPNLTALSAARESVEPPAAAEQPVKRGKGRTVPDQWSPIRVPCTFCDARAGDPCISSKGPTEGQPMKSYHDDRVMAITTAAAEAGVIRQRGNLAERLVEERPAAADLMGEISRLVDAEVLRRVDAAVYDTTGQLRRRMAELEAELEASAALCAELEEKLAAEERQHADLRAWLELRPQ